LRRWLEKKESLQREENFAVPVGEVPWGRKEIGGGKIFRGTGPFTLLSKSRKEWWNQRGKNVPKKPVFALRKCGERREEEPAHYERKTERALIARAGGGGHLTKKGEDPSLLEKKRGGEKKEYPSEGRQHIYTI